MKIFTGAECVTGNRWIRLDFGDAVDRDPDPIFKRNFNHGRIMSIATILRDQLVLVELAVSDCLF